MTPKTSPKFAAALIRAATLGPFIRTLCAMRRGELRTRPSARKLAA
ncbi:hypothetical protein ENSA5_41400 [Enhygromyxa salina]|uniref:Uncharacterized protein n=1 Tax=Enhygromyxa salina TaxID=215803 RepID=A0A2S9XMC2_9BACT|nr:hypothetical protein [Enhygromyxa salina]PRP94028.1 hypothetical protein ENSA5_41400 [Enhygromyxa salina]